MKLFLLGTSSGVPTTRRSLPGAAIYRNGSIFLFDCGEGTQIQLLRLGLKINSIDAIFISHMHGDHILGLMGLLMSMEMSKRKQELFIYGPQELSGFIDINLKLMHTGLSYTLHIQAVTKGIIYDRDSFIVESAPLLHRIDTHGFALQEKTRPGRFNIDKAKQLGIKPGPLYGLLQKGHTITTDDGVVIKPEDVLGLPRHGKRFSYCTDTRPCEDLKQLIKDSNLMLCDTTFSEADIEHAVLKMHLTTKEAAQIARDNNVKLLVLTHISPRYKNNHILQEEAKFIFENTILGSDLISIDF